MHYTNADVFVYQILNCLVTQFNYKIVNVASAKKDIWLANNENKKYPVIRLNAQACTSSVFEIEYLSKIVDALSDLMNIKKDILIINTNAESSAFYEGIYQQIILHDSLCSEPSIYDAFPSLSSTICVSDNNQEECARLTRELESFQMEQLKQRKKFSLKRLPFVSTIISVTILFSFLVSYILVLKDAEYLSSGLVAAGAYYKVLLVEGQEYWRFITMCFLHSDIITVLFFSFMLIQIGEFCEDAYGRLKYFVIFITSLLFGNLLPYILEPNTIFLGIAPGIFGLLAALILYVYKNKLYMNKIVVLRLSNVYLWVFVCFLVEGISAVALLGGFIWGLFLAVICFPNNRFKDISKHFAICLFILLAGTVYLMKDVSVSLANPEFDSYLVEQYKALNCDDYALYLEDLLNLEGE